MQLHDAIEQFALKRGDFTLKSGKKANHYFDIKSMCMNGRALYVLMADLETVLYKLDFGLLGGPTVGADAIVGSFLARNTSYGGFLVRGQGKDHGIDSRVIGDIRGGEKVVMLEDVTTSGSSLWEATKIMIEKRCIVMAAVTIHDREQGAQQFFEERGIPFFTLSRSSEYRI